MSDAVDIDPLRLTVLGSATPYPSAGNPCSGYLVSGGGTRMWMDAGSGTLGPLQRYVGLGELDAVWISHLHADHSADLLTAYYGLLFADVERAAPLPLFGPPGIADRLAGFLTNGAARSPVESAFAVHELSDGHRARVGALTLTSRSLPRADVPRRGVRLAAVRGRERPASGAGRGRAPPPHARGGRCDGGRRARRPAGRHARGP